MRRLKDLARRRSVRRQAGVRGRAKYRNLRRSWLRKHRRQHAILCGIGLAIVAPVNMLALSLGRWQWGAGLVTGAVLSLLIGVREFPPAFVENWQQGAFGEEFTAVALVPLERNGWKILHDLPDGHGNWDHIAVGPGGTFLLDSTTSNARAKALATVASEIGVDLCATTLAAVQAEVDPYVYDARRGARRKLTTSAVWTADLNGLRQGSR